MNAKKFSGRKDGRSSFDDLLEYISDAQKTKGAVWVQNCASLGTAWLEMSAVAQLSSRVRDPAVHLMVSWREGEHPTDEQALEAGKLVLEQMGLGDKDGYLSMIALHRDTENDHIHIGACRVHPETGKAKQLEWARRELSKAARRVELAQGWQSDNGLAYIGEDGKIYVRGHMNGPVVGAQATKQKRTTKPARGTTTGGIGSDGGNSGGAAQKPVVNADWDTHVAVNDVARTIEAHNGITSFDTYYKDQVGPAFKEAVATGSWDNVHKTLGGYGVQIQKSGGGYAVSDLRGTKGWYAKAGAAGCWARGARLEKKLGEFRETTQLAEVKVRYDPDEPHGVERVGSHAVRRDLRTNYSEIAAAFYRKLYEQQVVAVWKKYKTDRAAASDRLQKEIKERFKDLTESRKAFERNAWAQRREQPKHRRMDHRQLQSMLKMKAAQERERLEEETKWLRQAFRDEWDGKRNVIHQVGWRGWMQTQKQEGSRTMEDVLRDQAARYSTPTIEPGAGFVGKASPSPWCGKLANLDGQPIPGGALEYRDQGSERRVMTDHGRRIVGHETREDSIEAMLRLAKEKYGREIVVNGPVEMRKLACQKAAQMGLEVTNPESRDFWRTAKAELDRQRLERDFDDQKAKQAIIDAAGERMKLFEDRQPRSVGASMTLEQAQEFRAFDSAPPSSDRSGVDAVNDRWAQFERRYDEMVGKHQAYEDNGFERFADAAGASAELLKARHYEREWRVAAGLASTEEARQEYLAKAELFGAQVKELEERSGSATKLAVDSVIERNRRENAIGSHRASPEDRKFDQLVDRDEEFRQIFRYTSGTDERVAEKLLKDRMPEGKVKELLTARSIHAAYLRDPEGYVQGVLDKVTGRDQKALNQAQGPRTTKEKAAARERLGKSSGAARESARSIKATESELNPDQTQDQSLPEFK